MSRSSARATRNAATAISSTRVDRAATRSRSTASAERTITASSHSKTSRYRLDSSACARRHHRSGARGPGRRPCCRGSCSSSRRPSAPSPCATRGGQRPDLGSRFGDRDLRLVVRNTRSEPPPCSVRCGPRNSRLMTTHSMCQPGRPRPHGLGHEGSSASPDQPFQSATSSGSRLRGSSTSASSWAAAISSIAARPRRES